MAKDAGGHGSNPRGFKGVIPSRPFREGVPAHQAALDAKLPPPKPRVFGGRVVIPTGGVGGPPVPAHGSRIAALVKEFAASETGAGKVPDILKEVNLAGKEPSDLAETGRDMGHDFHELLSHHHDKADPSTLLNFLHFLGFLGAIGIVTVLAQAMGLK